MEKEITKYSYDLVRRELVPHPCGSYVFAWDVAQRLLRVAEALERAGRVDDAAEIIRLVNELEPIWAGED